MKLKWSNFKIKNKELFSTSSFKTSPKRLKTKLELTLKFLGHLQRNYVCRSQISTWWSFLKPSRKAIIRSDFCKPFIIYWRTCEIKWTAQSLSKLLQSPSSRSSAPENTIKKKLILLTKMKIITGYNLLH